MGDDSPGPTRPRVKVESREIRADGLAWLPMEVGKGIVLECDGFDYHSRSEDFARDRMRDRTLRREGYDILRYSGREIHRDPLGTSIDLWKSLETLLGKLRGPRDDSPPTQN